MSTNPFGTPASSDDLIEFELPSQEELSKFLVPNGDYEAKLVSVSRQVSKNSGNPMLVWVFVLVEGKYAGREFTTYTSFNALWKVNEVVDALGLGKPGEQVRIDRRDAVNRRAIVAMMEEEYNGNKSSKIIAVKPSIHGRGSKLEAGDENIPF